MEEEGREVVAAVRAEFGGEVEGPVSLVFEIEGVFEDGAATAELDLKKKKLDVFIILSTSTRRFLTYGVRRMALFQTAVIMLLQQSPKFLFLLVKD